MRQNNPFDTILEGVKDFRDNIDRLVIASVRPFEDEVLRLNTDEQLLERGIDNTGLMIEPPYHPITIGIKQAKGQITTHVTLRDTGAYHRSKQVVFSSDQFEIIATDEKADDLRAKYGDEIEGLTDENLQYLLDEFVGEELQKRFENAITRV